MPGNRGLRRGVSAADLSQDAAPNNESQLTDSMEVNLSQPDPVVKDGLDDESQQQVQPTLDENPESESDEDDDEIPPKKTKCTLWPMAQFTPLVECPAQEHCKLQECCNISWLLVRPKARTPQQSSMALLVLLLWLALAMVMEDIPKKVPRASLMETP